MLSPKTRSKRVGSASQVVIGFILGAALTFGAQIYADHVQDRRLAKQTRAQHIERLMIATNGVTTAEGAYMFRVLDMVAKAKLGGPIPDFGNLMPDLTSVGELRAVSSLYVPEVDAEVQRVVAAFKAFLADLQKTTVPTFMNYKPGDTQPAWLDRKIVDELSGSTQALETKLVELAKRDRE
jgi:hypothetical protein